MEWMQEEGGRRLTGVSADGVLGVELVRDVAVVFARVAFADGGFHETGEGGEDVDRWVDTLVVQTTVDIDLAFGDVTCQIWNGVSDICVARLASSSRSI